MLKKTLTALAALAALAIAGCEADDTATVAEEEPTTEQESPEAEPESLPGMPDLSGFADDFEDQDTCIEAIPVQLVLVYEMDASDEELLDAAYEAALAECETLPEPESAPDEPEGPSVGAIGDTATIGTPPDNDDVDITVSELRVETTVQTEYGELPRHGHFLIFTVELEVVATADVYEGDFYVLMADGTRFETGDGNSSDAIDYDDQLGWAELNAGERKSGALVFDVPEPTGELAYAPNYDGGPIVIWEF